ncbi:MAG: hypothetical protein VX640_13125 [Pseudomonadota bacterium]|nr:hypothetical protein [Pseudomonadota bacterium]
MAKGQMRSNKEKKKPKQDKSKKLPAGAPSAGSSQLTDLFRKVDDDKGARKGKK